MRNILVLALAAAFALAGPSKTAAQGIILDLPFLTFPPTQTPAPIDPAEQVTRGS
ncbi:hypothetical protein ROJ8625_00744 [Roseivivax jejudonensis]|uniref:Uncharacterized protein n=1 Tax=Roseivivax jejudonensis TaxID=1529041 RepID=A0A1X6YG81_9RHOB|nr:hypothetical protein [Roseivivax jejudonensis]SLN20546.1 hypothetical protein ROJ8625_00744 [Roseivivax jejudonensis]